MPLRYWVIMLFLGVIWGSSFFFIELALNGGFGPLTIVFIRTSLGALTIFLIIIVRGKGLAFLWRKWRHFMFIGFFSAALPFTMFSWGQQHIDSSVAALVNSATPMATLAIAVLVRDERLTRITVTALIFGLLGVALLVGPTFETGLLALLGTLAALLAANSYAVGAVYTHKRFDKGDSFETAAGNVFYASLMVLPLVLTVEQPWNVDFQLWPTVGVVTLGVVCTGIALVFFFRLIQNYGATHATSVTLVVPMFAFILGVFVLGERLGLEFYAGAGAILLALLILDGRLPTKIGRLLTARHQ